MKRGLSIILLTCLCMLSYSKEKHTRFTFGAEWSYCATFLSGYRFYFIAPEGYRVYECDDRADYMRDGEVYVHAGCNINPHWNLSLYVGYTGISDYHNGMPVSLRATRYFGDNPLKDRWFSFCEVGSGIGFASVPTELISAKAGGGYRLSLSRVSQLDFIASIRFIHTHPDIIYYGDFIPHSDIGQSSAYVMSASVGIGLTF